MPEIAFVGSIVPDSPPFNEPPFSRSGNLFQAELLKGLCGQGVAPSLILAFQTVPAFPKSKSIMIGGELVFESDIGPIRLLPFVNVLLLKQLFLGVGAFLGLLKWSIARLGKRRVIISYNLTAPPGVFLWAAARLSGAKILGILCDIEIPGVTVPNTLPFRIDQRLHRFLIPRLDGRVVVADAIAKDFSPGLPYRRMEGGVGDALIGSMARAMNAKKQSKCFRMVAVGKLDENNGFDLIVDAMDWLNGDDYFLDIAGTGPLMDWVTAKSTLDPRIKMHGFLDLDGVIDLYSQADLILVVRKTKARNTAYFFPGKIMEALLSGIPVLSTQTGHMEKEFGDYVYMLEDETVSGLVQKIKYIREQPVDRREEVGRSARQFVISNKHWGIQCACVIEYLQSLTGEMES